MGIQVDGSSRGLSAVCPQNVGVHGEILHSKASQDISSFTLTDSIGPLL
jgi:hypothetical protein